MSIPKVIDDVLQFFSGAVARIFAPSDDQYPNTGVQPFEGEVNRKNRPID